MEDILNTILKDTYSLTSLKHRLRILKSCILGQLFGGGLQEEFGAADANWLSSLPAQIFRQFNKDNISLNFAELETKISELKILTVYLPFDANEQTIAQIGEGARKTFGYPIVLDIKFDPALIAGCALSWNGIYQDYSLRSKIAEKRAEILASFKKFLR